MKRKRLDRDTWGDIASSRYFQTYINDGVFDGIAPIIYIDKANLERIWKLSDGSETVIYHNYTWLQLMPKDGTWIASLYYDENDNLKVCYIDIMDSYGICGDGVYWFDDIYLDIIITKNFNVYEADMDELVSALDTGDIAKAQFDRCILIRDGLIQNTLKDPQEFLSSCKKYLYKLNDLYKGA